MEVLCLEMHDNSFPDRFYARGIPLGKRLFRNSLAKMVDNGFHITVEKFSFCEVLTRCHNDRSGNRALYPFIGPASCRLQAVKLLETLHIRVSRSRTFFVSKCSVDQLNSCPDYS